MLEEKQQELRSSTDSNYSTKIKILLQREGVSIDHLSASPDDAQSLGAIADEATMTFEICHDEPLESSKLQDHIEGSDKSNELNGNSLLQASIFDRIVSYDRDDLDVFKELEIVARSIEAARSKLVAK
jgi:hypothetical protein